MGSGATSYCPGRVGAASPRVTTPGETNTARAPRSASVSNEAAAEANPAPEPDRLSAPKTKPVPALAEEGTPSAATGMEGYDIDAWAWAWACAPVARGGIAVGGRRARREPGTEPGRGGAAVTAGVEAVFRRFVGPGFSPADFFPLGPLGMGTFVTFSAAAAAARVR